ncbi:MAG TPA: hypothetical protein PLP01_03135 [Phycisphaerae bacterium]|nr:hypothetical protein [Phycisphaerae bacterium]HOI54220.1 hypothetical protein [Phycisphaerae bacterium]
MRSTTLIAAAGLLAAAMPLAVMAQDQANDVPAGRTDGSKVVLTWEEFIKITGYDPDKKGQQVITIPWDEVRSLLGVDIRLEGGTTVDLPWEQFKSLLNWSIREKDEGGAPPTDYVITRSEYSGTLTDDGAQLVLKADINVLRKKGWKRIPLLPISVALVGEATLPQGACLNATGGVYELLTDQSGSMTVTVPFAVTVQKEAGVNHVSFQRVEGGSSLLDLEIDSQGVDVKVAGAQSLVSRPSDGKTKTAAAVPAGTPLAISWERALPKAEDVPPKLYAETHTLVAVADGVLLCQETVNVNILHAGIRELKLAVPTGARILTVTGPNVQDWRETGQGELQVVLGREVLGSYTLRLAYELATTDGATVPVVRATGVEREKGFVGVIAMANVEIAAGELQGATSIDARQLPADIVAMTNQPVLLAFRYAADAFTIPLVIRRHDEVSVLMTLVDSAAFTSMQLNDGRRMTKVVYSVRNNRNQFLRLSMPEKADLWSVSVAGNTVSPARDTQGQVLVPLVRSSADSRELTAFPVEIVYVETPETTAPAKGTLRVTLPTCAVPVMHVMFTYYLPAEGRYTVGWGKSGFSGPLAIVDDFTTLSVDRGVHVVAVNPAAEAQQLQQAADQRADRQAVAAGATPIRVRLPIGGKQFKLEKILAMPHDQLYFEVEYSGWEAAR